MKNLLKKWNESSLVLRILGGLIIGVVLGLAVPQAAPIGLLGDLFVGALKAVAPLLVLFLVMTALSRHQEGQKTNMSRVILLYLLGTFIDGCVAVITSFLFPVTLKLTEAQSQTASPGGIGEVLNTLLMNLVSNPVDALVNANYIGILAWAVLLGIALRKAGDGTKRALGELADAVSQVVRWIIGCAPFGVLGLVFNSISQLGIDSLASYGRLLLLLVGTMVFVALVVNPLIAFIFLHRNPYPLVLKCLWRSGLTAFFTRSSAANIPVNLKLCEELGLIGAGIVLILFALLVMRGYWIAIHARDRFGALLVVGITTLTAVQVFLNISVVTNLIPTTGISLPFFSYGGTALMIQLAEMGIILSVSRQIPAPRQE